MTNKATNKRGAAKPIADLIFDSFLGLIQEKTKLTRRDYGGSKDALGYIQGKFNVDRETAAKIHEFVGKQFDGVRKRIDSRIKEMKSRVGKLSAISVRLRSKLDHPEMQLTKAAKARLLDEVSALDKAVHGKAKQA